MNPHPSLIFGFCLTTLTLQPIHAQERLADLLAKPGANLKDPESCARIVAALTTNNEARMKEAHRMAKKMNVPIRIKHPNGALRELAFFERGRPFYYTTTNQNAAISTAADAIRTNLNLDGDGITIGIWDGGGVRTSHQEFQGRATIMDGAPFDQHATHVGGTIVAGGVNANARGMAPLAQLDSYNWTNDIAEMTSRGATAPGQADKIYLSNHSYGVPSGWFNIAPGGPPVWAWDGDGTNSNAIDEDFGRYHWLTREHDSLAYNTPYYLIFRSAGNDRTENPSPGSTVTFSQGGPQFDYDPAQHPAGDGQYRGGFETIGFASLAKNIVSVGAVSDAVQSGNRNVSSASITSFSSWGPTDDGRIKPDLVANGLGLTSSVTGSDTAYASFSGTSMSCPNATGSAALLVELYAELFAGGAMRSSTLKGLLLHTADDLGNPGPDYKYGWGLMNVEAAADIISTHHEQPDLSLLTEGDLNGNNASYSQSFTWDGSSLIRATLCWMDPPGAFTNTSDSRTPRLVNDLNVKIIAPGGTEYRPFVMPFVGTWTQTSMDAPATTGVNSTDNVEQVLIQNPPASGDYQVVVDYVGNLTNGGQRFSVVLSGVATELPPPTLTTVAPDPVFPENVVVTITGTNLVADSTVTLSRTGASDVTASLVELVEEDLRCTFNLTNAALGFWDLTVTRPDTQSVTLVEALEVVTPLWREDFDNAPTGWTSAASAGSESWALTTAGPHTPDSSYFIAGPTSKSTTSLTSPSIEISPYAENIELSFWHNYNLESTYDGGQLELSVDGGAWFQVTDTNSGASFVSGAYNASISSSDGSDIAGQQAWSGNSNGYVQTVIDLTDTAKFAGSSLQLRWTLATDNGTASPAGWHIDTIALLGDIDFATWQNQQFTTTQANNGESAPNYDADQDGYSNFAEYALGMDPNSQDQAPTTTTMSDTHLTLTFDRPIGINDVFYEAEFSSGLSGWTPVSVQSVGGSSAMEMMQAQVPLSSDGEALFIRLRLSLQN